MCFINEHPLNFKKEMLLLWNTSFIQSPRHMLSWTSTGNLILVILKTHLRKLQWFQLFKLLLSISILWYLPCDIAKTLKIHILEFRRLNLTENLHSKIQNKPEMCILCDFHVTPGIFSVHFYPDNSQETTAFKLGSLNKSLHRLGPKCLLDKPIQTHLALWPILLAYICDLRVCYKESSLLPIRLRFCNLFYIKNIILNLWISKSVYTS